MFRLWGKMMKENRMLRDIVISNGDYTMSRTAMVFDAIDQICYAFDLGHPVWLDKTIEEFKRHDKARFTQDNFIESIDFDYLEIQVLEEYRAGSRYKKTKTGRGEMAQAITDVKTFLEDARQAVMELAEFEKQEETLAQEEKKRLRVLETERKAVADAVNSTVKRRRDEIEKSYDDELGKLQDKLKRTRTRREKAKNQGIKERIKEETQELHAHNRELSVRMRTLFQSDRVPFVCKSPLYYALYFPRGFKEFLTVLITFAICFLLIPCGIYKLLPEQKTLYLAMIYGVDVVVFGGLYILIGNWTKDRHLAALQEGRSIRSLIAANNRKIAVITSSIRRDRSEALYDLEKYDDEISQMEQDLEETAKKKKDALNTFENVTKTILTDEITSNSRAKLEQLKEGHQEVESRLHYTETVIKEKRIFITDTYECYLGKEFLNPEKLDALKHILDNSTAVNLSEVIAEYRERGGK